MEGVAHGFVRLVVHLQEHDIWVLLRKLGNLQGIIIKDTNIHQAGTQKIATFCMELLESDYQSR